MFKYFILAALLLAACQGTGETAVPRAASITCHAAYRSGVSVPIEREESFTLADEDSRQALAFADLVFQAQYSTGQVDNERALLLRVTEQGQEDPLTTQLYQLPPASGPQNQFVGGHGFTGLNYVYHPTSGAELQFWCTAG